MANLCLLRTWNWLFGDSVLLSVATTLDYVAVFCNVLLLAVFWWILLALGRLSNRYPLLKVFRLMPVLAALIAADFLRAFLGVGLMRLAHFLGRTGVVTAVAVLLLVIAFSVWTRFGLVVRLAEVFCLIVSPFLLITVGGAAWSAEQAQSGEVRAQTAQRQAGADRSGPRVLWLLFDEMDQRITFSGRPAGLLLPELDRFRETALYATGALPPGMMTHTSIPSMMSGRVVYTSDPNPNDFLVALEPGGKPVPWSSQTNLFSAARREGAEIAVASWYFPYCRLLGPSLTKCSWHSDFAVSVEPTAGLHQRMLAQLRAIEPWNQRRETARKYRAILQTAKELAVDRDLDLVYIHWPIPHSPGMYDREKGQLTFSPLRDLQDWYLDNLVLVDRTMGELRRAMEQALLWESTTILITSDHPWRRAADFDGKADPRVPFLWKLAGQNTPVIYDGTFNTVLIHDLILAFLRKEISDPQGLVRWLDEQRAAQKITGGAGSLRLVDPEE